MMALLMLSSPGVNLVLCIGADGHITLEMADSIKKCYSTNVSNESPCPKDIHICSVMVEECCYNCVDIPIPAVNIKNITILDARPKLPKINKIISPLYTAYFIHPNVSLLIAKIISCQAEPASRTRASVILRI